MPPALVPEVTCTAVGRQVPKGGQGHVTRAPPGVSATHSALALEQPRQAGTTGWRRSYSLDGCSRRRRACSGGGESAGINRHGGGDERALRRRTSDPRRPRVMRRRPARAWRSVGRGTCRPGYRAAKSALRGADTVPLVEGNTAAGAMREPSAGPARSKNQGMCGTFMRENREIPCLARLADHRAGRSGNAEAVILRCTSAGSRTPGSPRAAWASRPAAGRGRHPASRRQQRRTSPGRRRSAPRAPGGQNPATATRYSQSHLRLTFGHVAGVQLLRLRDRSTVHARS